MKKVMLATIAILIFLSGRAFAEDPVMIWDNFEETQVTAQGQACEYHSGSNAVLNVVTRSGGNYLHGTAIIKHNALDGSPFDEDSIIIDGRNTVAKTICKGAEPGEYVTTGYHDNGEHPVMWTSEYSAEGWGKDEISLSDVFEQGYQITQDDLGNYYVVGITWNIETGMDVTVVKYNSNLEQQWKSTYEDEGEDYPYGIAKMDSEYLTVVAEKSHEGEFESFILPWNRNDGSIDDPSRVFYGAKMVDTDDVLPAGGVYIRKWQYQAADDTCFYIAATLINSSGSDIWTACSDYEGNYLWEKVFDSGHDDEVKDICMGFGYVYVVGSSENGTDSDARMIRYDEAGNETWNVVYDNGKDEGLNSICLDPAGNFYVGGYIREDTVKNALLIKYSQPDVVAVEEQAPEPTSVNLEVADNLTSCPTVNYSLPQGRQGTLTFYAADGRKLETFPLDPAQCTFSWVTDRPSGVYYVRLVAGTESMTSKLILTR